MKDILGGLEKWTSVTILLLLGVASVFLGVSSALEPHWIKKFEDVELHLVYATIGLLAFALGIERLLPFRRWEKQLIRMEAKIADTARDLLEKSSWAWFLPGEGLFEAAIAICRDAQIEIRALALGETPRVRNEEFANAVEEILKAGKDRSLKFTSVYSLDFLNPPEGFEADSKSRMLRHEVAGVSSQVSLRFIHQNPQIGLHCLLVDDIHTMIGVTDPDTAQYRGVLLFRNQPEVTKQLVAWFEDSIIQHSVSYDKVPRKTKTEREDLEDLPPTEGRPPRPHQPRRVH